jgi:predicted  nucleic acid-binding Zn-ribbon protein
MEAMRESWTDDRMDDLNGKVDALHLEMRTEFKAVRGEMREEFRAVRGEMREEFRAVRGEMKEEFAAVRSEMKASFDRIDARFQSMDQRLLDIYRMMFGFCGLMLAALIGLLATQL